jgi:hypothetical protein
MLKAMLTATTIALITTPVAIAQDPICYTVTSTGQMIDLTSVCTTGSNANLTPIVVSNLSLSVPEEEFLSSKIKATVTNRSNKPVKVSEVRLQINRANTLLTTVPIVVNQTLSPGQSIPATEIFDKAVLQGQDPNGLSVSFQGYN